MCVRLHVAARAQASDRAVDLRGRGSAFGNKGLVDIVMLIGLYIATCAIINAFEVPVPEADTRSGAAVRSN